MNRMAEAWVEAEVKKEAEEAKGKIVAKMKAGLVNNFLATIPWWYIRCI